MVIGIRLMVTVSMHVLAKVPKLAHFFVWKGGFVLINVELVAKQQPASVLG